MEKIANFEKFLKDPNLVEEVLKRLGSIEKLPASGILAGGSVANSLLTILDKREYPVNDIDIFIKDKDEVIKANPEKVFSLNINRDSDRNNVVGNSHYHTIGIFSNSYTIKNVYEFGKLNIIEIYISSNPAIENAEIILSSFDINQTMVAIDLESKRLFYTPEFVEFLETRQLKIIRGHTPFQSLIRIMKKQKELNAYLNIEKEIEKAKMLLTLALNYSIEAYGSISDTNPFISNSIGKNTKVFKLYLENKEFKSIIDKHFIIKKNEDQYKIYPRQFLNLNNLTSINPMLISKLPLVLDNLLYGNRVEIHFYYNVLGTKNIREILLTQKDINKVNKNIEITTLLEADMELERLLSATGLRRNYLLYLSQFLSVEDFIEIAQEFKRNTRENISEITKEMIENLKTYIVDFCENNKTEEREKLKADLINILNAKEIQDTKLKQPENLEDFPFKDNVEEITSKIKLLETANEFRNCLSSYEKDIKAEKSLIFIIETKYRKTLLEIGKEYIRLSNGKSYYSYTAKQHRGKANTNPDCSDNEFIAYALAMYLNKKEYETIEKSLKVNN